MSDDIVTLLKVNEYFRGASDEALEEVARHSKVVNYATASVIHEANVVLTSVGFVLRGRLKIIKVDARGKETLFRIVERGEQFGMMVGVLNEPVPLRVVALEPATVLSLDYEQAMELTVRFADLRRVWLKTYAGNLRKLFLADSPRRAPAMLALIHESPETRRIAARLVQRLLDIGEKVAVFSDSDQWQGESGIRFRSFRVDPKELNAEDVRRQAAQWQDANRIIFDLSSDLSPDRMGQLLGIVDRAIIFALGESSEAVVRRLRSLDIVARGWRDKISVAWLLRSESNVIPVEPGLYDLISRDFKIVEWSPEPPWGGVLSGGLERLIHDLRGIRIGVALGGGAARGMAHLGVLKALEQNGIVVDMIAGTSAGAMTGIMYASGLDPSYCANQFSLDLQPSWVFRRLPQGSYWYLLYKYRRGHFDPMLRKYLQNWKLEQLSLPCLSVTVDLVGGQYVSRESGDAVHAILESINLPVLSVPICHNGQALVDGGLVNNIPANVLVSMGCNFVIAVSVTAKMEQQFCNITSEKPTPRNRRPNIVQTLMRSLLVQSHSLNAFGVQPADVVIEPDVTGFDLTEFTRAKELAAIGEAAASEQVSRIRQLLFRLDPLLFPMPAAG